MIVSRSVGYRAVSWADAVGLVSVSALVQLAVRSVGLPDKVCPSLPLLV